MKRRVAIVGTGWVGSSVAISTLHSGVADELLLHDMRADVAEGEAMDLAQGSPYYPTADVRLASLDEVAGADAIVVAAGRGGRPGQTRLDLLRENATVIKALGQRLAGSKAIVIVVTNPVDVMTQLMANTTGLPPARVIGTGTMLDTARLRQMVGHTLRVDPRSVHAHVVAEHGDSEVVLWSSAHIGGTPLRQWPGWTEAHEHRIAEGVRTAAYEIIRRKGATNHAIGLVTADLLRCVLRAERRVLTVSRIQAGVAGVDGVALSLPAIVDDQGAAEVLEPELSADERTRLEQSAQVLRKALAQAG